MDIISAIEIFFLSFLVNLTNWTFFNFHTNFIPFSFDHIYYWKLLPSLIHFVCLSFAYALSSLWLNYHFIFPNYRLFKLIFEEFTVRIIPRDAPPLESVGPQKCLAFSTDGAKFAIGGEVWVCIILISEFWGIKVFSSHFSLFSIPIVCFFFQQFILTVCTFKPFLCTSYILNHSLAFKTLPLYMLWKLFILNVSFVV